MKVWKNKALVLGLSGLFLVSCKEEKIDRQDDPQQEMVPVEVKKTVSGSSSVAVSKYHYDAAGNVYRADFFTDNKPQGHALYFYYPTGKLKQRKVYNSSGQFTEQDVYILNNANQHEKYLHSYVNAAGTDTLHHYQQYEYTPDGKIARTIDFSPKHQETGSGVYVFETGNLVKLKLYDGEGNPTYTHEYTYDGRKSPLASTNLTIFALPGNVTEEVAKDLNRQVVLANSSQITYNPQGYPVKITRTHKDGITKTETYSYRPK